MPDAYIGITVTPIRSEHWSLLDALFETSPGVKTCACMWPLTEPKTFRPDETANKSALRSRLRNGDVPGLIAVIGEEAVGWSALGPRQRYPQYEPDTEGRAIWAMPCLYVKPAADRTGVARALIERAVGLADASGAIALDGPPPWWSPGDAAAIAMAVSIFLENGFETIGAGARFPSLRRSLC